MAADNTRIYLVLNKDTGTQRLVEATSQSQAIRHCTHPTYLATVATGKIVGNCVSEGIKIEKAIDTETKQRETLAKP